MEQIFNKGVSASVRNELPAWKQAVKNGKVIVFAAGNNVRNQPSIHSGLPAHDPNLTKDGLLWWPLIQINRKRFIPIDADLLLIGVWQRLAGGIIQQPMG